MYVQYTVGESCVETKTEADSGDFNECPQHDMQSAGMFTVSNTIYFYSFVSITRVTEGCNRGIFL